MCNNEEFNKERQSEETSENSVDWEKLIQELLIKYDEVWKKLAEM